MDTAPPKYEEQRYSVLIAVELYGLFFNSVKTIEYLTPKCAFSEIDSIVNYMLLKKFDIKYLKHTIKSIQIAKPKKYLISVHYAGEDKSDNKYSTGYFFSDLIEDVYDEEEAKMKMFEIRNKYIIFHKIIKLEIICKN